MKLTAWLALALTLATVVDAMVHHAYVAAAFLVLTLRLAAVKVLRAHHLWGRG